MTSALDSTFDSRVNLSNWETEDTTMLAMSQEIDDHTNSLRKSVLASVASIRQRIHQQTADLIEREREDARETQRRLVAQIDSLAKLVDQRNDELEAANRLNERLVNMISTQKRRQRDHNRAAEALRQWNELVKSKKHNARMVEHLTAVREERDSRRIFNAWRVNAEKMRSAKMKERLDGEHRREVARMTNEFRTTENRNKLELIEVKEKLNKEEERQQLLQEKHKAAFMRGVCAMNMEAMQAIRDGNRDDVSIASLLQDINVSGASYVPTAPQAGSTDRLVQQQMMLNEQLNALQVQNTNQMPEPMGTKPPQPQPAAAAPQPARNEPRVTVTVNPRYSNSTSTMSAGGASARQRPSTAKPTVASSRLRK